MNAFAHRTDYTKYNILHVYYTSLNNEMDRLLTLLALGPPSLYKTLIRVEYMSNGVVNRLVLFLMLAAIFGYLRSNHLGNTNEKNGIRSSSLPCCVLRTDANLRSNISHTHRWYLKGFYRAGATGLLNI